MRKKTKKSIPKTTHIASFGYTEKDINQIKVYAENDGLHTSQIYRRACDEYIQRRGTEVRK